MVAPGVSVALGFKELVNTFLIIRLIMSLIRILDDLLLRTGLVTKL